MIAKFTGEFDGDFFAEEKPCVGTIAGAGAFDVDRDGFISASFAECSYVFLPVFFVKVDGEEIAGFI